jgi:hypothetical protein
MPGEQCRTPGECLAKEGVKQTQTYSSVLKHTQAYSSNLAAATRQGIWCEASPAQDCCRGGRGGGNYLWLPDTGGEGVCPNSIVLQHTPT